ncbi:hypothetical protein [Inquilinus sp. OTU3971]|uniref:hypothetical protein n=1 Tax=Inquilinus sp. OTU3971 TaxID=3043855 RepID=UPI00313D8873
MAVYMVNFRIESDKTYGERYKTFTDQLKASSAWWDENTSFVVVQTTEEIDDFCYRIYYKSDFDSSKDKFVVLDAYAQDGRALGQYDDRDLFKLLPFVKEM